MKPSRIAAAIAAAIVLTSTLVAVQPAVAVATAPTPVVQGNKLVDSRTGETFVPRGVNIPGLEYSCVQGWTTLPATGEFAAIASWKINTVRLPLNESCWLGLDGAPSGNTVAGYKADVKAWVDGAVAAGLAVILDLHWNAPAGYTASGQRAMPDPRSASFWSSVAATYATNKSVMFELFNEPYSRSGFTLTWDCWKNGGCLAPVENDETGSLSGTKYTVTGMQTLVTAVRNAGATQPVLLGGLNYSNDLSGWLANKPTDPLNQLVVAWHNYPGQGCSTSCWNSTVTTVAASYPIVTTEFGNTAETTSTAANESHNYLVPFMTWADAHGIGYLPWAWWDVGAAEANGNGSDIYALYTGNFVPKSPSGTKFHNYLASLPTATPTPTPTPTPTTPPSATNVRDFSGDAMTDVVAKNSAGELVLYRGNGAGGWAGVSVVGTGWNSMSIVFITTDFSGDGRLDVMARDRTGNLWLYRSNGAGGWGGVSLAGTGWNGMSTIFGAGDFSGDGFSDIMARDSAGNLWVYKGDGAGGWLGSTNAGWGWNGMTALFSPGDFDGDGFSDVMARDGAGNLWLYRGNGAGGWLTWSVIGTGWNGFVQLSGGSDFSGDGFTDVLGRDAAGNLWIYRGNGQGGWLTWSVIGTGWNGYSLVG